MDSFIVSVLSLLRFYIQGDLTRFMTILTGAAVEQNWINLIILNSCRSGKIYYSLKIGFFIDKKFMVISFAKLRTYVSEVPRSYGLRSYTRHASLRLLAHPLVAYVCQLYDLNWPDLSLHLWRSLVIFGMCQGHDKVIYILTLIMDIIRDVRHLVEGNVCQVWPQAISHLLRATIRYLMTLYTIFRPQIHIDILQVRVVGLQMPVFGPCPTLVRSCWISRQNVWRHLTPRTLQCAITLIHLLTSRGYLCKILNASLWLVNALWGT